MGHWSRRRFLEISALGGGATVLKSFLGDKAASASESNPQLLLFVYFSGGWDQLLAFDPRDNSLAKYSEAQAYAPGGSGIYPAYHEVVDTLVESVMASTGGKGVQQKGNVGFGPAIPASLLAHYQDLSVVRGMSMETLTHEVGRRYMTTGKFPRGLAANGSSLSTFVAMEEGAAALVPNLSIGAESYNEGLPAYASAIRVNSADDVLNVLRPLGTAIAPDSMAAIEAYEDAAGDNCQHQEHNGAGLVDLFRDSRTKARGITDSTAATLFKFSATAPDPLVKPLMDAMQIATTADLNGPKGKAAIAAQALVKGVSQAVSVQLCAGLDDHFEWATQQATTQRVSFDALGLLIKYLKANPFKDGADSVWDHTTMVVFSEFARTPLISGRGGRDHHLASSCLVAGPGIKGNVVIGATKEPNMGVSKIDVVTGKTVAEDDDSGVIVRPADVHATLLESMGLSHDHISNQSPKIIDALLV
jgi:uncharacterized protein (DUF1501 family)